MNAKNLVVRLYRAALSLYPQDFRQTYGDEMLTVFADAVDYARQRGPTVLVLLAARELCDLPFNLIREHLHTRRLAMSPEYAKFRRVRWLARIFSLLSAMFYVLIYTTLFAPATAVQAIPALMLVYVLVFVTIFAWVQEWLGGLMLLVGGALLGLAFGYASLASGMQTLHTVLVTLMYPLPYWLFGAIFLMLGSRKKSMAVA